MTDSQAAIRTIDDLRAFVHTTLCAKENLLEDQFQISETRLTRRGRECGIQFSLHGPRSVRLGAIWASDQNIIYFYDARGERYLKTRLTSRVFENAEQVA